MNRLSSSVTALVIMVVVPIGCALFFVSLLHEGLPLRVPASVVDLDHSAMSREVIRALNATELVDICKRDESYAQAMSAVKSGEIFGFFVIPEDFEKNAVGGNTPTLEYYTNMTYFVPGTLSFKGFKTIAVSTAGSVASAKLEAVGLTSETISPLVQPVVIDSVGIGNPWINYSYYLTPSFTFGCLGLIIMIFTVYTITVEIKHGTSVDWLSQAGGSINVALAGKLLPQTVIYIVVSLCIEAILFRYLHFPMSGALGWLLLATAIFVPACQSFAVMVSCLLPNPRLALSVVSLFGILTFSFAGFSFPVEKMYGAIAIFSYLSPVRYLFLIYINQALNGFDVYYVRYYFVALLLFLYAGMLFTSRLKKMCLRPVYVP
ncbi:MAG: ABC transporter permease [Lachnospiraceae bacterium]|nr:ABC transporter permease [Lachnospiraceae bacterium]